MQQKFIYSSKFPVFYHCRKNAKVKNRKDWCNDIDEKRTWIASNISVANKNEHNSWETSKMAKTSVIRAILTPIFLLAYLTFQYSLSLYIQAIGIMISSLIKNRGGMSFVNHTSQSTSLPIINCKLNMVSDYNVNNQRDMGVVIH